MSDELFVDGESFGVLLEFVGSYVFLGVGLAICFWVVGLTFGFVHDFLRGGV